MIEIIDFFIFFAKLQRKRSKRKQLLPSGIFPSDLSEGWQQATGKAYKLG